MLLNIVTPLHQETPRDYLARMNDDKVHCMGVAKQYGKDYWDGDRRYGYGGYKFIPGRWAPVAKALIDRYKLFGSSRILDVGCGMGFLLYEIKLLLPGAKVTGFDISQYGLDNSKAEVHDYLFLHNARNPFPFDRSEFDLVVALGCLHNLKNYERAETIREIERVGHNKFIMVESYRNDRELFNLECWALTAQAYMAWDEWVWEFRQNGYTGDCEFIFFE